MSESDYLTRVSKQYLKYRAAKARIKERHKRELVELAKEDFAYLGQEINQARSAGFKVENILTVMGLKNRTFIYDALRAYDEVLRPKEEKETPPEEKDTDEEAPVTNVKRVGTNKIHATVEDETLELTVNGRGIIVDMPESWLRDLTAQKRDAVKEVIKTTRELFAE